MYIFCEKPLATFSDVLKPTQLIVTDDHIYMSEAYRVHIYSMGNFKHKKSFGKKGEGPKEFNSPFGGIGLSFYKNKLYVGCYGKELTYDEDGNYLNERKWGRIVRNLKPIKGGYFSYHFHFEFKKNKVTYQIAILDKDLNVRKILHEEIDSTKIDPNGPIPALKGNIYAVLDNRFIILYDSRKDGSLKLFSHSGDWIRDLKIDFPKIKIKEPYRDAYIKQSLKPDRSTQFSAMMSQIRKKRKIKFPEYFPPFRYVASDHKNIYIFRDIPDYKNYEVWVLNYTGKILNKHKIKKQKLYSIHNGIFYYLQENEDTEEWELFSKVLIQSAVYER